MASKQFVAAFRKRGFSDSQARAAYARLKSEGYENPTEWHAPRYEGLLANSFLRQRKAAGVSPSRAKRELRRLNSEGISTPGSWHAERLDALYFDSFVKARESMGVPAVIAEKEYVKLQYQGIPPFFLHPVALPGRWHAERLPRPEQKPKRKKVIDDMGELLRLLEESEEFTWEDWVSSLEY